MCGRVLHTTLGSPPKATRADRAALPRRKTRAPALLLLGATLSFACSADPQPPPPLTGAGFEWDLLHSKTGPIYAERGSFADRSRASLPDRVDSAKAAVLDVLGIEVYPDVVTLVYVDSREDMRRLVGRPVTGWAFVQHGMVVLVFNERWRAFERHEMAHVVAVNAWGDPGRPAAATMEGMAVLADGDCGGYPAGEVVRTMLERELLLPSNRLFGSFRAQDDLVAYLQAASLYEYAVTRVGGPDVEAVWRGGLSSIPGLLGIPPSEVETSWRAWLVESYDPLPESAWEAIRENGCGIAASVPAVR